ncbi:AraC family ligand binding domain-containing protein [Vibrio cholerae]
MDTVNYRPSAYPAISLIEADYRQFAFERHYHLDIHIGLITQGVQRFYHQGAWHQVGQGSVVLMSPDELHDGHAHSNTGYQVQVFSIEPEWLQQTLEANQIEQVIGFEQLIVQDTTLFHSLQQLHHLLRQDNLSQLDQPIRLEQLAQLCQLSPTQFQRHFKAQTGLTPYAWLRRLRLEQAMKLLQSGKPGTDVAYQVGFYDQAHFSKAFKATYGLSPSLITRFS